MMIKKVAIYLRKSRNEDSISDAEALENHRETLTALADSNEWSYNVYAEIGSSMKESRPELNKLLKNVSSFDAVLVMDIDRLSRDRYHSAQIMQMFKENHVKIVTADGRITDLNNDQEEIMTGMQEVFANYEYNMIKKRLQRGKQAAAKKGNWATGRVPLGYEYDRETKRLKVREEESKIVVLIFQLFNDGYSAEKVSIELNRQGYKGKNGKSFVPSNVLRILRNDVYRGHTTMLEHRVLNTHEAIIEAPLWESVHRRVAVVRGKGSRVAHELSGILKCGYCGKTLAINIQPTNGVKMVKGCHRRDVDTGVLCRNRGFKYEEVYAGLTQEIKYYRHKLVQDVSLMMQRESNLGRAHDGKVKSLEEQLNKVSQAISRLNRAFVNGDLTDDEFSALKEEKVKERVNIEERLQKLKDTNGMSLVEEIECMVSNLDKLLGANDKPLSVKALNEILKSVILEAHLCFMPDIDLEPKLKITWRK
ncbi:Recombinase family protein [Bacillus cereus]|nr:Recombinase family protein [Bacillus cereus]ARO65064.1 Recombinase family protein [Bacillus cereus]